VVCVFILFNPIGGLKESLLTISHHQIRKPFVLSNFLFYATMFYYFLEVAFHKLDYVTSNDLQYIERVSLFLLSSFYVINI